MRTTKIYQMLISYGADIGIDRCYLTIKCKWSLSTTYYKRLNNQNGEIELAGLVIDWHIFDNDRTGNGEVIPAYADSYQPTYAYA